MEMFSSSKHKKESYSTLIKQIIDFAYPVYALSLLLKETEWKQYSTTDFFYDIQYMYNPL